MIRTPAAERAAWGHLGVVDAELQAPNTIPAAALQLFGTFGIVSAVDAREITFQDLYSRYAAEVYRFVHWLTGNSDDAQDITSETFVRAWTAPEEPRMETVKAYLMAFAIFFSLAPFSFSWTGGRVWWLLRDAPSSALVYAALGVVFWVIYTVQRHRSRSL